MAITNSNSGWLVAPGSGLPLGKGELQPTGAGSLVLGEPETASPRLLGAPSPTQTISTVFRSVQMHGLAATPQGAWAESGWLLPCVAPGSIGGIPSLPGGEVAQTTRKRLVPEGGSTGETPMLVPTSPAADGGPFFRHLPQDLITNIFYYLEPNGKRALSMSCKFFSWQFHRFYRCRCQLLRASDRERPLFKLFGIDCPEGEAPSHAQMEAMAGRIDAILGSTKRALEAFPKSFLPPHTAKNLLLWLPPEHVHELLETAYQCDLYKLLADLAELPDGISLRKATRRIHAWLDTAEARATVRVEAISVRLTSVFAEIGRLKNVQTLELWWNELKELPAEIGLLTSLRRLNVSFNPVAALCPQIVQLTNLQELRVAKGCIKRLPAGFGQLVKLQVLDLAYNQLKELPAEVGLLTSLRELHLSHNQLGALGPELWHMTNLEQLWVGGNHLRELPAMIGLLVKLQILWLDINELQELPAEVGKLTNLEQLQVGENHLNGLPAGFGQLTSLQRLYLPHNQLAALGSGLWQLTNLEELEVSNNHIKELPAGIGQLQKLRYLNLSDNQLEELPPEIGQLRKLRELGLENNRIYELPVEIGQLRKLKEAFFNGNPISYARERRRRAARGAFSTLEALWASWAGLDMLHVRHR